MPWKPSLIIHGGAGKIPAKKVRATRRGLGSALEAGWNVLCRGGSALDAVEAAIVILEDDPTFNAGTGAHLNRDGRVQLDAILMDGTTLKAGAVAAVERIRNPIRVARGIQQRSPHMMLVAEGAEQFASANGFRLCDPAELVTEQALRAWRKSVAASPLAQQTIVGKQGTVGAVAFDCHGGLAAGTSTGGTFSKYPGRIGDSPLIGCGCYADTGTGAVSCTGQGEAIMKIVMAKAATDMLRDGQALAAHRTRAGAGPIAAAKTGTAMFAQTVADAVILKLARRTRGTGGLILLDSEGRPAAAYNGPGLCYGYVKPGGRFHIVPRAAR